MEYTVNIPNWNKSKFEKYIKSLKRKGLDVQCEDLGRSIVTVDDIDYMCTAYTISNDTLYQVSGWKFIGTIEHKEGGNIIRNITEVQVPERYKTAPNECEHCHTIRNRIDTYLVMSPEGEFKQVGKSCLKAYTGLNPAICALAMDLENELERLEVDKEEVILGGYNSFGTFKGFDGAEIKKIAYAEIKANGYRKETTESANGKLIESTKEAVCSLYNTKNAPKAADADIEAVDAWVAELDTEYNDYFRNASIAYKEKYYEYRDFPLVISLIACYFKDMGKKAEYEAKLKARAQAVTDSQEAGYAGEVGEKVEFEVASDYILFRNEPYVYGASWSYTHKIVDTKGHVILWATSADTSNDDVFPAGTKIKGAVKAHKEFRGELQTVITRGKANMPIVEHPEGTFNIDEIDF